IVISSITTVEMVSMLMQKQRQNIISATQFVRARNNFLKHVAESYITIDVNENLLRDARGLVTRYPLRTLDALQLASALETIRITRASVIFVSADNRLLSAAVAEGLTVDNPINYP